MGISIPFGMGLNGLLVVFSLNFLLFLFVLSNIVILYYDYKQQKTGVVIKPKRLKRYCAIWSLVLSIIMTPTLSFAGAATVYYGFPEYRIFLNNSINMAIPPLIFMFLAYSIFFPMIKFIGEKYGYNL